MAKIFKGDYTREIVFPLGGIGAGSVGLAGNGMLVDWEINNRPNRDSINPFTNFAIKAEDENSVLDMRLVQGDTLKDFIGNHFGNHSWGYGHGPNRGLNNGFKHFSKTEFSGEYPFANIKYSDKAFPGEVELVAFNPFIPSNDKDSSMPCAFFEFKITNNTEKKLKYTLAFSLTNPLKSIGKNKYSKSENVHKITMDSNCKNKKFYDYGNVCFATDCEDVCYQENWFRGGWFDNSTMFINEFSEFGKLKNRKYDTRNGKIDTATLAGSQEIMPGETKNVKFVMSWFVPNYLKYWVGWMGNRKQFSKKGNWKNYYASLFNSSEEVADYCFKNWNRLYDESMKFKNTLMNSSLPVIFKDAIQGNIATLKSTTCLRLTNGEFWGWEGVNKERGSCEGTCQHVWNYAYALPFLFPKLERSIRDVEYDYAFTRETGKTHFRVILPLGKKKSHFRACVDGQMGTIMKFYRDWKICGDNEWLKKRWSDIKKTLEYAWSPKNPDKWDINKTGVMFGRQHHTLDVEMFGANSWLTGYYHGALLACAEMAEVMGENDLAKEYRDLRDKGHKWIEENTFNGDHYIQKIDVKSTDVLDMYGNSNSIGIRNGYFDSQVGEIKYQYQNGCYIDQVVADWHADLMGLPNIFYPENRKKALESIYKLNFKSMRDLSNPCRIYACDDEKGVVNCVWAEGVQKPKITVPYTEEVFTGFEYALACNMLQCGMEDKAVEIVKAIRDRYDGKKRNPWAEIECGTNYARAMASYSLLIAYSGFKYDLSKSMIGFKPVKNGSYFWSIEGAWGDVKITKTAVKLTVLYGEINLKEFLHSLDSVKSVKLNGKAVDFTAENDKINMNVNLKANDILEVK